MREARVRAAAQELFRTKGDSATSMRQIADAAGVSVGAGVAMSTSFGPGLSVWLGPGWVREANPE